MDWIENLKAGDSVVAHTRYQDTVCRVDKVTPTGRIKIGNTYYNKDGNEIGGEILSRTRLYEATPEALTQIAEAKTIKKALQLAHNVSKITFEQAVKLIDVLENKDSLRKEMEK